MKPSTLVDTRAIYCGDNIDQLARTRGDLDGAVEAAKPTIDADGPALMFKSPVSGLELKPEQAKRDHDGEIPRKTPSRRREPAMTTGERLTDAENIWRSKGDEQLVEAAARLREYTEEGQRIIRAELRRRNLSEPTPIEQPQVVAKNPRGVGWLWPSVETPAKAAMATKQAFWAAVLCAVVSGGFGLLVAVGAVSPALGMDSSAIFSGAVYGAIAIGLWKESRLAAWAGLVLYCLDRAYAWSTVGPGNSIIAIIFILAFIGGVRGTSALDRFLCQQRLANVPAGNPSTTKPPETSGRG